MALLSASRPAPMRCVFLRIVAALALAVGAPCGALAAPLTTADRETARYTPIIAAAGNAESDAVRIAHLRTLAARCATDGVTLTGIDGLIAFVARWDSPAEKLNFFKRPVFDKLDYDFALGADSPLQPIADLYRARMITWVTLEYSEIYPYPEKRAVALGRARRLFESARAAFPQNRVIAMYLGEPFPPERTYAVPPAAPAWAVAQREGLERLTDILEWWIDHRLRPAGDYGGGWGDDCEMWRHAVPVLLGFEHPRVNAAQTLFSTRLLAQPHLAGGYHNVLTDVEHTAEDAADALTPMMFLAPENPAWAQRVNRLVELAETRWMGRNARDQLQFKSTFFTVDQVDLAPARACDTVYHPRALQPALLAWQRTGDPRIGRLVTDWMRTWVDAAARTERGKPAGILPTAIHWPDGAVGGVGVDWWRPENDVTPLYDFPSAMGQLLNTLVLTAHQTGDDSFHVPLRTMAAARLDWIKAGRPAAPAGSRLWCGAQLAQLGGAIAKYRLLTGRTDLDALLRAETGEPYMRFRLDGDVAGVSRALAELAGALRVNFPAYTQEVRFTDRVLRFPVLYEPGWMLPEGAPQRGPLLQAGLVARGLNNILLLYQTATGDPGDPLYFPLNAVRWCTPPRDIAALVTGAGEGSFSAQLYHFGVGERAFDVEFLRLKPGAYRFELRTTDAVHRVLQAGRFSVDSMHRRCPLVLPSRVACVLTVTAAAGKF